MIEKIEIQQHSEGRDLCSHPSKESYRLLCVIAYHHEMVTKLRKDCLNSLSETFVDPSTQCPVLLVQPIRHIKGNVSSLKHVLLYGSTLVALILENRKVTALPLNIFKILQIIHIGCGHVIGMNNSTDIAHGIKLVSVIVHVLRGTVAPGWYILNVILTHLAPGGTSIPANLYRLGLQK